MEGIEDAGCVLEQAKRWRSCCPWKDSSVAIRTPARKSSLHSSGQVLYTVLDLPGIGSNQTARRVVFSARQVQNAGQFPGQRRRRSWWCHTPPIHVEGSGFFGPFVLRGLF